MLKQMLNEIFYGLFNQTIWYNLHCIIIGLIIVIKINFKHCESGYLWVE